jgi:hypothetical protein
MAKETSFSFASTSVPRHLLRGIIGFGALIGSFALTPVIGLISFALLPVGFFALRGCPMCWTMGLIETISAGRLKRSCADGSCSLSTTDHTIATHDNAPMYPAAMDIVREETLSTTRF